MALKAVPVLEIPTIDKVPEPLFGTLSNPHFPAATQASFAVIGHRGCGMNLPSSEASMRENSILSFNAAGRFPIPFIELDVQVTRDGFPVVFHDVFILTHDSTGAISEHRVADLSLEEFLSYGHQRDPSRAGKPLLRRDADGCVFNWVIEADDSLCTLQEAFLGVNPRLGFNIELKFDDDLVYREADLANSIGIILWSVSRNAGGRSVIFSSFHPDAARIVRRLQGDYPVFFLTDGGTEIYSDARRNSMEEAVRLCVEGGLEGIVAEARAVLRNPAVVARIREGNLRLLTYGELNNTAEMVFMQHMMGIDGVIVDRVQEISEAVSGFAGLESGGGEGEISFELEAFPKFSGRQLSYFRKLIAELARQ